MDAFIGLFAILFLWVVVAVGYLIKASDWISMFFMVLLIFGVIRGSGLWKVIFGAFILFYPFSWVMAAATSHPEITYLILLAAMVWFFFIGKDVLMAFSLTVVWSVLSGVALLLTRWGLLTKDSAIPDRRPLFMMGELFGKYSEGFPDTMAVIAWFTVPWMIFLLVSLAFLSTMLWKRISSWKAKTGKITTGESVETISPPENFRS